MNTFGFVPLHLPGDLPIFRQDHPTAVLFYTPGYLALVDPDHASAFADNLIAGTPAQWPEITALRDQAASAQQAWMAMQSRPFAPVCLTLYLNNECNLRCTYCYAMPSSRASVRLTVDAVRAAAEIVAVNCQQQKRPFFVVFHGGGEPTLHRGLVDSILDTLEQLADSYGLTLFRYIATNGVMSATKAAWLAARFDLIGLSCDGPAAIQAYQRPLRNGHNSTPFVEQTARMIRDAGKMLHVRVTITPYSAHRQAEIAEYLCQQLKPNEIHVEPVYRVGRADMDNYEALHQADAFVNEFLRGRAVAQRYSVPWLTSGSRLDEIHGPYCQVFRDVLNLVPSAVATACFKVTRSDEAYTQAVAIGAMNGDGRFVLDQARIQDLRARLGAEPTLCVSCFNRYHCARSCPEYCPLDGAKTVLGFRCQVQQLLTNIQLQTAVAALKANHIPAYGVVGGEVGNNL